MSELFVKLFLAELRKAGFLNVSYDKEQDRVIISPDYSRLFVICEDGEYLIHYDADSSHLLPGIKSVRDTARMITKAWEVAEPMNINDVARFRKLLSWNGIVLAARDDGDRGLHFVTWQYDNNCKGVSHGHYTNDATGAMRDFAGRSCLIPKDRIFSDEQLDLFRSALTYKLENDDELSFDAEEKIKLLLSVLEP